ncbi:MAG: FHA domain-containing protein [Clostridiales bacterium]|nr:FHA domain-containing protein [Clostridiales bacterium]
MELYIGMLRYVLPLFAVFVIFRCAFSLIKNRPRVHKLAQLRNEADGSVIDIEHWETSIGRGKSNDIALPFATVSRFHGVISKRKRDWILTDTFSRTGITVNGEKVEGKTPIYNGDEISFGNVPMTFLCDEAMNAQSRQNLRQNVDRQSAVFIDIKTRQAYYFRQDDMLLGRSADADLHLEDQSVSKRHAHIYRTTRGWAISDLGSSNGTRLNGDPIHAPQLMFDEDRLTFGTVTLIFYEAKPASQKEVRRGR